MTSDNPSPERYDDFDAALTQAREARLHILNVLNLAIETLDELSTNAPRIILVKIPVDKIGAVSGPKSKMINQIQVDAGTDILIEDDGTVLIGATDGTLAEAACSAINAIANPQVPGRVEDVEDVVSMGQKIQVEITKIDDRGKLSLAAAIEQESVAVTAE